jgi:hypothetical protein
VVQQERYRKTVEVWLILIHFKCVTNKLLSQKVKKFQSIVICFILFYKICSDMTGERSWYNDNRCCNDIYVWRSDKFNLDSN